MHSKLDIDKYVNVALNRHVCHLRKISDNIPAVYYYMYTEYHSSSVYDQHIAAN